MSTLGSIMPTLDLNRLLRAIPTLKLLVLFGSQARGTATEQSDWDVAIQCEPVLTGWEQLAFDQPVATSLGISSDRLDLVNLPHCSPLLGYAIARDGQLLYEAEPGLFRRFQLKAWKTYADTAKLRHYQTKYIQHTLAQLER
jgi:predicted nucleotidyltransferase